MSQNDHLPTTTTILESCFPHVENKGTSEQRPPVNNGHKFRVPKVVTAGLTVYDNFQILLHCFKNANASFLFGRRRYYDFNRFAIEICLTTKYNSHICSGGNTTTTLQQPTTRATTGVQHRQKMTLLLLLLLLLYEKSLQI